MAVDPRRKPVRVEYRRPDGTVETVVETDAKGAARIRRTHATSEYAVEMMAANARAVCSCGAIFDWSPDGYEALTAHTFGLNSEFGVGCEIAERDGPSPDVARLRIWLDWNRETP